MADPIWTAQYNFGQTPESNGFTRVFYGNPPATLTLVTSGAPANRRVEIADTPGAGVVMLLSAVPSFDDLVGATAEFQVAVTGAGDAGFEVDFLGRALLVQVFETTLLVTYHDPVLGERNFSVATPPNNTQTLWRLTYDGPSKQLNVYRAGVLVAGPLAIPDLARPFQRFLWWGEDGGTQIFTTLRFYIGGAVAP